MMKSTSIGPRMLAAALWLAAAVCVGAAAMAAPNALFTTDPQGQAVNHNHFLSRLEVYISGGPSSGSGGLAEGDWVFQVTDPSGKELLSLDPAACRVVRVVAGTVVSLRDAVAGGFVDHDSDDACHLADAPDGDAGGSGRHDTNPVAFGVVVQLMPFAVTPNSGGVYKVWMLPLSEYLEEGGDLDRLPDGSPDAAFGSARAAKTDNFKVKRDANQAPVADAGEDRTATVGAFVTLDGSGSYDPDADPLAFSWAVVEQPSGSSSSLDDPTAIRPTLLIDAPGRYVLELIVNDGELDSQPDAVAIDTANSAPVADAGPDKTTFVGLTATLNGSRSSDADGDPLTFDWRFLDRPDGSLSELDDAALVMPAFIVDLPGSYRLELVVDDGALSSAPDEVVVTTENSAPVANAGADQTVALGATVTLDASGSTDVDGDPLTYLWSFISRPEGSEATLSDQGSVSPTFVADEPGVYVVQLVANDGAADSEPSTVTVSTVNSTPVAAAGADQTVAAGDLVTLDGTGSTDADGQELEYSWSLTTKPEGSLAELDDPTAPRPSFVADVEGTFVAQLLVSDGELSSEPDTVVITSSGNSAPVADAGDDQIFVLDGEEGALIALDGSGSFDVDGDALSFSWSLLSSPVGSFTQFDDPTSPMPTLFISDRNGLGTYIVQLIVSDGELDSEPDTVTLETANVPPFANAGPDQTAFVGDTVELDGSGSFDVDGDPLTFFWSLIARPEGSTATLSDASAVRPTFVMDVEGTYVAQLVVNDGEADSFIPDTVTITTANVPPVADAGPDQSVLVGDVVALDGTGSSDADGDPLTFSWSLTSRPAGSTAALDDATFEMPTFEVDQPGTYLAQLIVNDGLVDSAPDSVAVSTAGSRPVADAGEDQIVFAGDTVILDGTASSDADGEPLEFFWSIVSAPAGSAAAVDDPLAEEPALMTDLPGIYVVQLIVNDGGANSRPDTVTIEALPSNTLRLLLDSPVVGIDRSIGGTVVVGMPAPAGGLPVTLSSDDPAIATVSPAEWVVPAGETIFRVTVDGLTVGATTLLAIAPDFNNGVAGIEVTDFLISLDEDLVVAPGEMRSLPVSLSQPAPPGGLTLFLETDDPSIATIEPSVFVPGGQQLPLANPQVTGGLIGATRVEARAERFAPDSATITVTLELRFQSTRARLAADTRDTLLLLSAPAPSGGLVIDLSTDDAAVASVPATIVAVAGETAVAVPVTGVGNGATVLRASAAGVAEASIDVEVNTEIRFSPRAVGKDLQEALGVVLQTAAPPAGAEVTLTSSDPSRLLLSLAVDAVGSEEIVFEIAGGQQQRTVWVQALAQGGTVAVAASAPGYTERNVDVELAASGFAFVMGGVIEATTFDPDLPLSVAAFPLQVDTLAFVPFAMPQALRPGVQAAVELTSSDAGVADWLNGPLAFGPLVAEQEGILDLLAAGTTNIGVVAPPSFSVPASRTERPVTVSAPTLTLSGGRQIGAQLQVRDLLILEEAPPAPVDVTVTIDDPGVALVSLIDDQSGAASVVVPGIEDTGFVGLYLQGLAVGTTSLRLEAPGYATSVWDLEVFPSGIRFDSFFEFPTTTLSSNRMLPLLTVALINFNSGEQEVRGGFSVELDVVSSDPSVVAVVGPTVVRGRVNGVPAANGVEIDPLAGGTSVISFTPPPGFEAPVSPLERTVRVTQPGITITSSGPVGDVFHVGKDMQAVLGFQLHVAPPAPTDVTVAVGSSSAVLSTASTVMGSSASFTFEGVVGTQVGQLYLQALEPDSTTLTVSAEGYATTVLPLEITPSGFVITTPSPPEIQLTTLGPNQALEVEPATLDAVTLERDVDARTQTLRPGLSIPVEVVSSEPDVAAVTSSPVLVTSPTSNGFTELDPLTAGTTLVEAVAPPGFATPASGHQKTVFVDAPDLRFQPSTVSVGRDLQRSVGLSLETTPPEPVTITVTSTAAALLTVATDGSAVGQESVSFEALPGQRNFTLFVEGRALGSAQLVATAAGYDDGVATVRVDPSGFVHASFVGFDFPLSSPPFNRQVLPAMLNPSTHAFVEQQFLRPGITVEVEVSSSAPDVLGVLGVPIVMERFSSGTYQIEPLSLGPADITVEPPAGFDTPSNRTVNSYTVVP